VVTDTKTDLILPDSKKNGAFQIPLFPIMMNDARFFSKSLVSKKSHFFAIVFIIRTIQNWYKQHHFLNIDVQINKFTKGSRGGLPLQ